MDAGLFSTSACSDGETLTFIDSNRGKGCKQTATRLVALAQFYPVLRPAPALERTRKHLSPGESCPAFEDCSFSSHRLS
jgi:hypothetical protein